MTLTSNERALPLITTYVSCMLITYLIMNKLERLLPVVLSTREAQDAVYKKMRTIAPHARLVAVWRSWREYAPCRTSFGQTGRRTFHSWFMKMYYESLAQRRRFRALAKRARSRDVSDLWVFGGSGASEELLRTHPFPPLRRVWQNQNRRLCTRYAAGCRR